MRRLFCALLGTSALLLLGCALIFSGCVLGDTAKSMLDRWTTADQSPADPRYYDARVYKEKNEEEARICAEEKNAVPASNTAASGN